MEDKAKTKGNDNDDEGNTKAEINEEMVKDILDMEFDTLEEWADIELNKVRDVSKKIFMNFNLPVPTNKPSTTQDENDEEDY